MCGKYGDGKSQSLAASNAVLYRRRKDNKGERKADMMNDDCVIALPAEIILELLGGKPGGITVERNRETGEITIFAEND